MNKCPICLDVKELIFKYNCEKIKHGICNECFSAWTKNNKTCSECRALEIGYKKPKLLNINGYRFTILEDPEDIDSVIPGLFRLLTGSDRIYARQLESNSTI